MPMPNRTSSTAHSTTVIAHALRMSLRGENVRLPIRRSRVRSSDQPLRSEPRTVRGRKDQNDSPSRDDAGSSGVATRTW